MITKPRRTQRPNAPLSAFADEIRLHAAVRSAMARRKAREVGAAIEEYSHLPQKKRDKAFLFAQGLAKKTSTIDRIIEQEHGRADAVFRSVFRERLAWARKHGYELAPARFSGIQLERPAPYALHFILPVSWTTVLSSSHSHVVPNEHISVKGLQGAVSITYQDLHKPEISRHEAEHVVQGSLRTTQGQKLFTNVLNRVKRGETRVFTPSITKRVLKANESILKNELAARVTGGQSLLENLTKPYMFDPVQYTLYHARTEEESRNARWLLKQDPTYRAFHAQFGSLIREFVLIQRAVDKKISRGANRGEIAIALHQTDFWGIRKMLKLL